MLSKEEAIAESKKIRYIDAALTLIIPSIVLSILSIVSFITLLPALYYAFRGLGSETAKGKAIATLLIIVLMMGIHIVLFAIT